MRETANENIKGLIFIWGQNICEMLKKSKEELTLIILIEQ